jgi:transposase
LYIEDGYPALAALQFGISDYSVNQWAKLYQEHGEQGLMNQERKPTGSKLPAAVTQRIVDLKEENPGFGIRRIYDFLRRFFLVRASPSTVHAAPSATTGPSRPAKEN